MESLAPPLRLVLAMRRSVESGESVASATRKYLQLPADELTPFVTQCLLHKKVDGSLSPCREAVLTVMQSGLDGQPILPALMRLEQEIIEQCQLEMQTTLDRIPFQLLWPMLLLQFPAYLLLLIGPLMEALLGGL
ncbi:MAG: hypothetical protein AB7F59_14310 [Bdellovibrionales bacterium]